MPYSFQENAIQSSPRRQVLLSQLLTLLALSLVLGVIFITISRLRLIDGDEGFYVLAAKLVYHGKVLYRDFFYTQMPFVPYAYGAWMQLFGETWNSARLLSALAADVLGCLLYLHLQRLTGSRLAGLLAVLLFTANISSLAWFPIVKTHAFSALFLFVAYMLVSDYSRPVALLFAGISVGLAVDTRLYLVATTPVFLFCVYQRRNKSSGSPATLLWFLAGLCLALSPNIYWLLTDPRAYYFNNLGFHMVRSNTGFFESMREKIAILTGVLGVRPFKEGSGVPFGILAVLNLVPFVLDRKFPGPRTWLATWLAFAILLVCLLPSPTFYQYFAICMPFLIPGAVMLVWELRSRDSLYAALVLLVLYLAFLPYDLYRYTVTGTHVLGVDSTRQPMDWQISAVRDVSRQIQLLSRPGQRVLSLWPGYLLETDAIPVSGIENHTALAFALSDKQHEDFHLASALKLEKGISQHTPCLVVLGNQESMVISGAPYEEALSASGYRIVSKVGDTSIYKCQQ